MFLGLGLPWVIAATYMAGQEAPNNKFITPPGNLAYSVGVFLFCSVLAFICLIVRRRVIGGELGGPKSSAYASSAFFIFLWILYVVMSIIKAVYEWPDV